MEVIVLVIENLSGKLFKNLVSNIFFYRKTDLESFTEWIWQTPFPIDAQHTKIVYKFSNLIEFHSNDETANGRILEICFNTLFHMYDSPSAETTADDVNQIILLMRICANIVAIQSDFVDWFIENLFIPQNRSLSSFFNFFTAQFPNSSYSKEVYWFLGNLVSSPFSNKSLAYLESDGFFENLQVENCS